MRSAVPALAAILVAGCGAGQGRISTTRLDGAAGSTAPIKACPASRVRGERVRAGPFVGLITRPYDVYDGRFQLRVGGMRDATLSQKIPWFLSQKHEVDSHLRIVGRQRDGNAVFRARFAVASGDGARGRWVFPSILNPPSPGCWRLRFVTGDARGALWVRVIPAPRR